MEGGLLSLKWNNHRTTFFHVLSNIRKKEAYTDTTLACDGKFYPVHKLVLSTCSEYFEQIFERAECKHPVIILKDIVSDDLEALLNYMYLGEVNVLQEKLSSLIKAAECLKIRGLAVPDEDPAHSNSGREKRSSTGDFGSESKRRKQDSDSSNQKSRDSTNKDRPKEESNVTTSRSSPSDSRDFPDRQSDPGGGSSSKSAKKPNRTSDDFVEERVPPTEYESDIKKEPQEVYDLEEEEDTKENLLQVEASLGYLANNEQGADEGPLDRLMGNDMASGDDNDSSNLPGISGLQMKNWNSNENLSSGSYDNFATQDDTGQMASMMYLVVEFTKDQSINLVPETWYNDGMAWWPDYTSDERINRAIQSSEEPGAQWDLHDVRILTKSSDYLTGRKKLKKALVYDTCDLQSEAEIEGKKKRRRTTLIKHQKYFHESDDDDQENYAKKKKNTRRAIFPSAPLIISPSKNYCILKERSIDNNFEPQTTPNIERCTNVKLAPKQSPNETISSPFSANFYEPTTAKVASPTMVQRMTSPTIVQGWTSPTMDQELSSPNNVQGTSSPNNVQGTSSPSIVNKHQSTTFVPAQRLGRVSKDPMPCSQAELYTMTLLENLRQQICQINASVNYLLRKQNNTEESRVGEMPDDINFPLSSLAEVDEAEEWLLQDSNKESRKQMISVLATIGGKTLKNVTWNILSHIFSNCVAKQINWKGGGQNNKRAFSNMAMKSLVIRAVRKNVNCTTVTDDEVCKPIIRWFNLASDRDGGRKARSVKNA